ncbi:ComEC/Rec2 family competence protein [Megamonas hypermegale]|uniref:ComEC family competence protein n=1 Tax=Megamonas hypermegale TaxID=158847 RepID=A0A239TMK7_9FIRM|nr:ComEC/Rec2 family competence protein [Megamonas hypermegale]SNU98735.1 ComEC family competence protein [Megamonas hypermegale]
MKKFFILMLMIFALICSGCSSSNNNTNSNDTVKIEVLDIGQGDASLIYTKDEVIMIDTGDVDERDRLEKLLKERNISTIDKLIITHPHADHIGGAYVVFKNVNVKEVYDNGDATTSKTYQTYLKNIKQKNIAYHQLKAGDTVDFGDGVSFKVFSPTEKMIKNDDDLNNNSIVGQLRYKDFTMLFTGDSERDAEQNMVKSYGNELQSDVLKSPHHGSRTSSSDDYLKTVKAKDVIISLAADNEYGHPHKQTLDRYKKYNMNVYRTDQDGTITITTDGSDDYTISKEK